MDWSEGVSRIEARAPGRLDVMGGIADYSGSLVLQTPISEETRCKVQARSDRLIKVESSARNEVVEIQLDRLLPGGDLAALDSARSFFGSNTEKHWASYVIGVLLVLVAEEGVVPQTGISISVDSDVPEGKGVSSSAALEVSAMRALVDLFGVEITPERIAILCQKAENLVAGAPCGIMDQMTASCGQRGKLMMLLCQPARLLGHLDLPEGLSVWGIDSGVRHAVTGSDYGRVRAGAFMGLRIIEKAAGGDAARFHGYLANVTPSEFGEKYLRKLPQEITGADFLRTYGQLSDSAVTVEPDETYPVAAATAHPIMEHDRNQRFVDLLQGGPDQKMLAMAGELMYLSHASYSACGLGSNGTDRLVEMVRAVGYHGGLFGARITGGGSGGTVAVLGHSSADHRIGEIAHHYERETGLRVQIF